MGDAHPHLVAVGVAIATPTARQTWLYSRSSRMIDCIDSLYKLYNPFAVPPIPHPTPAGKLHSQISLAKSCPRGCHSNIFGHLKCGVHDPLPRGTCLYRRLTFGLASHQANLGQTVRDSKELEFKPNGLIPPVGLGPVRASGHRCVLCFGYPFVYERLRFVRVWERIWDGVWPVWEGIWEGTWPVWDGLR